MKRCLYPLVFSLVVIPAKARIKDYNVIIEPQWYDLEQNDPQKEKLFGGKWMLVGTITFEKKAKDPISLRELYLRWNGENLARLNASLYKRKPGKPFLAIEENLLCDGTWNATNQTLTLPFGQKQSLGPVNKFYLVLTVPKTLEQKLKRGNFCIEKNCLPHQFRLSARDRTLSLAVNKTPTPYPAVRS